MAEQTGARTQVMMETCSTDAGMQLQLQQALEQISNISAALCDVQCYFKDQVCKRPVRTRVYEYISLCLSFSHVCDQVKQSKSAVEESSVLPELQNLREQLETREMEKKMLESQLSEANRCVTQLQEEGSTFTSAESRS